MIRISETKNFDRLTFESMLVLCIEGCEKAKDSNIDKI